MTTITPAEIVRNIRDLPALPLIVAELITSFERPDVSVQMLADKVSQDQVLAAKTLRLANSSFYGLQSKVRTIHQAINVLGFDSVRALLTGTAIIGNFDDRGDSAFDFRAFWRHAIASALCAKSLARITNANEDYAFISGLLHDIGTLVLVTRFPEPYMAAISYRSANDCSMLDAERTVLAVDHAAVGGALAEYWKFPALIQRAIADHHAPMQQDLGGIPSIVHVADAIAHALDLCAQEDDLVPHIDEEAWKSLKIGPAEIHSVFRETEAGFESACQILVAGSTYRD
ncbi:MAG: HDOD domain-containing protein [Noviherbaspirillum sp.]